MRLASKIFVASSLVVVVLVMVGILRLSAVGRLVTADRSITEQTVRALRKIGAMRDAMVPLGRLEMRFVVLRDARYARLWDERAGHVQEDLAGLRDFVHTRRETTLLRDAVAAFQGYRAAVQEERDLIARGDRAAAVRLAEHEARVLAERVETSLRS